MPGIRKPTNVLELNGAFKKNPDRGRAREHEPTDDRPVGNPPKGTDPDIKSAWRELKKCAIPGVLTYADRPVLLAASTLYARMKDQRGINQIRRNRLLDQIDDTDLTDPEEVKSALKKVVYFADTAMEFKSSDQANLTTLLARLGMTPVDRSKLVVPKKSKANAFDDE